MLTLSTLDGMLAANAKQYRCQKCGDVSISAGYTPDQLNAQAQREGLSITYDWPAERTYTCRSCSTSELLLSLTNPCCCPRHPDVHEGHPGPWR